MIFHQILAVFSLGLITFACQSIAPANAQDVPAATESRFQATDTLLKRVSANTSGLKTIVTIDHARLAQDAGVTMPPAVVTIYSDPLINTALMKINPRVGLDLPQKILIFEESGQPQVAFPTSMFLAKRHGISNARALDRYDVAIQVGLRGVGAKFLSPVDGKGITRDYGISEITSEFPHEDSIARLKMAVMKQGDTVWFGEIDLTPEIPEPTTRPSKAALLLFGGPKPGGVAMAKFPKLGLDAFCQKLLVYEDASGDVKVIFNNIATMAKLHYGASSKPHDVINGRLMQTFESAIKIKQKP